MEILGNNLLLDINESYERLKFIRGYIEIFDEEIYESALVAVEFTFEKRTVLVVAQEDDSLKILTNKEWQSKDQYQVISLMNKEPWMGAKNKPLLWSWIFFNQQGYFDGLQLEFAEDVSDTSSVVIQLVAMASEISLRKVASKLDKAI